MTHAYNCVGFKRNITLRYRYDTGIIRVQALYGYHTGKVIFNLTGQMHKF